MKVSKKQGFTLVEIMIVVAIIGVLAAIAIPSFQRSRQTARANICVNNLRLIESAVEQWGMATGAEQGAAPAAGVVDEYIRGGALPECPEGGAYDPGTLGGSPECGSLDPEHGSLEGYLADPRVGWGAL